MNLYNFINNHHWIFYLVSSLVVLAFAVAVRRKDRANIEQYEKHYHDQTPTQTLAIHHLHVACSKN